MTPKEYAKFLIARFEIIAHPTIDCDKQFARQCALITVDEIIKANPHNELFTVDIHTSLDYWDFVKQEIQAL
jgi:hypothetical protein